MALQRRDRLFIDMRDESRRRVEDGVVAFVDAFECAGGKSGEGFSSKLPAPHWRKTGSQRDMSTSSVTL